ncbi:unnamed protein product, partial [Urochloa humidicola]
ALSLSQLAYLHRSSRTRTSSELELDAPAAIPAQPAPLPPPCLTAASSYAGDYSKAGSHRSTEPPNP